MDIFDFLFRLVEKFGLIESNEYKDMYGEMDAWRTKELNAEKAKKNWMVKFYCDYGRQWFTKLGLALLFIPSVRGVHRYLNPEDEKKD